MSFAIGPAEGSKKVKPSRTGEGWPPYGIRSVEGLKPYVPQQRDGIRIEPGTYQWSSLPQTQRHSLTCDIRSNTK